MGLSWLLSWVILTAAQALSEPAGTGYSGVLGPSGSLMGPFLCLYVWVSLRRHTLKHNVLEKLMRWKGLTSS